MTTEAPFSLELETRVRERPETVFAFFTDPVLYRRWQGHAAELDPRPGGLYRVSMPGLATVEGRYIVVEVPRRIAFTWGWVDNADLPPGSTTVDVTLTPEEDDTVVRLVHQGLPTELSRADHTEAWRRYLARLRVAASGGDPGPELLAAAVM